MTCHWEKVHHLLVVGEWPKVTCDFSVEAKRLRDHICKVLFHNECIVHAFFWARTVSSLNLQLPWRLNLCVNSAEIDLTMTFYPNLCFPIASVPAATLSCAMFIKFQSHFLPVLYGLLFSLFNSFFHLDHKHTTILLFLYAINYTLIG